LTFTFFVGLHKTILHKGLPIFPINYNPTAAALSAALQRLDQHGSNCLHIQLARTILSYPGFTFVITRRIE
jgi:hypothetical protein